MGMFGERNWAEIYVSREPLMPSPADPGRRLRDELDRMRNAARPEFMVASADAADRLHHEPPPKPKRKRRRRKWTLKRIAKTIDKWLSYA